MARTYLSGLVVVVHEICKYTVKYGHLITPLLTSPEKELFLALVAMCNDFMNSTIVGKARGD